MAYATDILGKCVDETKKLFFPVRIKYWLRMGFISLFSGRSGGGRGGNGYNSSNSGGPNEDFSAFFNNLKTEATSFFTQYGVFIGVGIFFLWLISLFFVYLNSVFTFVFIDGIVKKDITIKKGWKDNKKQGVSLFALRFVLGLVVLLLFLLIASPVLFYLFTGNISNFNFWLLIPMILLFILLILVLAIFWFLVYDFVVPIMYFKKKSFFSAWNYFKKIAKKKKLEIFIYWLMKIALSIGIGIISIFLFIPLFIILLIIAIPFVLIGVGLYLLINLLGQAAAILTVIPYGIIVVFLFIYLISVVYVPFKAFMTKYSLEMVKKLEGKS